MNTFLSRPNMEEICNRIHRAILDEPDMTQLSITTQEIKDLSLKTMRDVANSWKGEKVSVQNDVAVRIAVKYFETLLENPTEQEQVAKQRDTNSDHGSNLPTALRAQKEIPMDMGDLQTQMHMMVKDDASILLSQPTLETLPDKHKVFEEYISLDGGERDTSLQPQRFSFSTDIEPLRTVSEVKVWSVILPLTPKDASSVCYRVNVTHVWLWVDEISGSFAKNRTDVAKRSLCKLLIKGCHEPKLGRGHMVLEPAMEEVRVFDPPLSSLSSFGISLRRPDGALMDNTRDDFRMINVYQTSDAAANWIIEMNRLWEDDAFTKGDILKIQGIENVPRELTDFLTRKEGHIVISQGYPVGSAYKTVVIRKPGSINQSTGEYEGDINLHSQLDASGGSINGRVINMSTQVSISVSCKCNTTARHFDPSIHTTKF
jgi:hypothetical protein